MTTIQRNQREIREAGWRDSIVTLIDIVGIKSKAQSGIGSTLMQNLYQTVLTEIQGGKYSFVHTYAYNDAVLVLSYVDTQKESFQTAMRDADKLKKHIDESQDRYYSYAIAVKGQVFPNISNYSVKKEIPFTIIKTSSWAMANCFEIEKAMKKIEKPWYVDGRIARKIQSEQKCQKHKVKLFPSKQSRYVYSYDGYLWDNEVV